MTLEVRLNLWLMISTGIIIALSAPIRNRHCFYRNFHVWFLFENDFFAINFKQWKSCENKIYSAQNIFILRAYKKQNKKQEQLKNFKYRYICVFLHEC